MTLKQIKYFETVCRIGSVTGAADELYVSRPVISRALKELEDEFGVELFTRTRLGLELTESGKLLQNLFFEFSGSYAAMQERICRLKEHRDRRALTIGITCTCGKRFYPKLYNSFRERYPDIKITVTELSAFESRDCVTTGSIDFFFTPKDIDAEMPSSMLGSLPLYSSQTVFCTARGGRFAERDAVAPREIFGCPMALLYSRVPVDWPLNVVMRTSQQDLIRKAVSGGAVNSILPLDMVEDWDGVVGVPFDPPLPFTSRLLWNKAIPHSSAFNDFLDFMLNYDLESL